MEADRVEEDEEEGHSRRGRELYLIRTSFSRTMDILNDSA